MFKLFWKKIQNFFKIFHNEYWILKKYKIQVQVICELWKKEVSLWSDRKIKEKTSEFIQKHQKGTPLKKIMNEAYAVAAEAIKRVVKIDLHPVQILGSIVLFFGDIAEMKTGEGKTLTSVLPLYLHSFTGRSSYVVTVNEYLVNRDCEENGKIFNFLNVSVGKTLNQMSYEKKQENYLKSIVYGTNSEFGFDYLRDNMYPVNYEKLQKEHYYVIVDEVDSVLIDEGRTPLIISGNPKNFANLYKRVDRFVKNLKNSDFKIDAESKRCFLQKPGILKANHYFGIKNLFDIENSELFHFISNSLQANYILKKNVDYLVKKRKVLLIDQFTGRVAADRMLSEGLHQSLEAKESCFIQEQTSILGTITYQNYFRLFDKIAGMTGTAKSEQEEFIKLYNMDVLSIDTHEKVIRNDDADFFFYDKKQKYLHLIQEVKKRNNLQQPILIGTCSVQTSEEVSLMLRQFGLSFQILNAKHHEHEAKMIEQAGNNGMITIATNMAGRGTDIKLDAISKKVGGLAVLGVERNESRRIDLQLQGRSGRQGEPGYSVFYISLDDDLFLRFGNSYLKKVFKPLATETLKSRLLSRTIRKAQKRLQNQNYDQRKMLLEYDNVISQQRRVFYKQRDFLLKTTNLNDYLKNLFLNFVEEKWTKFFPNILEISSQEAYDFAQSLEINRDIFIFDSINEKLNTHKTWTKQELVHLLQDSLITFYQKHKNEDDEKFIINLKQTIISTMDRFWVNHLDELFRVKASSFLQGYAQKNPLQSFIEDSDQLFLFLKRQIIFEGVFDVFNFLSHHHDESFS